VTAWLVHVCVCVSSPQLMNRCVNVRCGPAPAAHQPTKASRAPVYTPTQAGTRAHTHTQTYEETNAGPGHAWRTQYSHASLNDGGTFWEMRR